jgi:hypothetical protein
MSDDGVIVLGCLLGLQSITKQALISPALSHHTIRFLVGNCWQFLPAEQLLRFYAAMGTEIMPISAIGYYHNALELLTEIPGRLRKDDKEGSSGGELPIR